MNTYARRLPICATTVTRDRGSPHIYFAFVLRADTSTQPEMFDLASGKMVITYQTFLVRTPKHTILIDTCTGEDKGYPAPFDFPKQPWLDGFRAAGLRFEDVDYVFCTHLHIDHTGWNTQLLGINLDLWQAQNRLLDACAVSRSS